MSLEYWDYRSDLRNIFVTPELRSRFMRIKAGTTTGSHTHDLGHEVFLVLEGEIEFDVAGRKSTLGPGQMCIARVDEPHTLHVVSEQDATIYLSVTPHIAPTHTQWDASGQKRPPRYGAVVDGWEPIPATAEMVDQHLANIRALAEAASASALVHERASAALHHALVAEDAVAARASVDAMWDGVRSTYQRLSDMAALWNQLAPRATLEKSS